MSFELDHLFICTTLEAPEADQLISFGLTEGTPNVHPGQGTSNRRFFFHNLMLELLWVHDPTEAQSGAVQPIHLWERWSQRDRGACPFGVCLRPALEPAGELPFTSWNYHPPYLPPSLSIPVATNADIVTEPMLFYLSFGQRQDTYPVERAQPLQQAIALQEVTRVEFVTPHANSLSPELQSLVDTGLIDVRSGAAYALEFGFDGEQQGKEAQFQPGLPLRFCW
ncbi:hypothetical protein H6G89_16280 [Oscillatoria sp. FACHB-1407]|uniref:hypothetical protein n=1 Tax=Oscillatoria sp. FACHB-1407 TaxID=2692847 RepID=UPI001684A37B|nr:hypothetical protein [Oscillatoria sp. FACHB-1407]MBD2462599.1 hypothetical protein [Oscillatoria sp. FACHB-1407]